MSFWVTQQNWSQAAVGLVTTGGGLLALAVQVPIGGLIAMPETAQASEPPPATQPPGPPPGLGSGPTQASLAALASAAFGCNS